MKKLLLFLILVTAFAQNSFAAKGTMIEAALLDASPTSVTSEATDFSGANRVGFYVAYDETQVGGVSAAVTLETSFDGTNFVAASFYDFAGGATFQTSETLTADGYYYFWVNADSPFRYLRVKVTATGSDADDTVLTTVNFVTEQ